MLVISCPAGQCPEAIFTVHNCALSLTAAPAGVPAVTQYHCTLWHLDTPLRQCRLQPEMKVEVPILLWGAWGALGGRLAAQMIMT